MPTKEDLRYFQAMPLEIKIAMTRQRIREWVREYGENGVYVSFSGGKDSTVLLDLVRQDFPSVEAVFVNTGLEYPEIQRFVKTFDNVTILRPTMRFDEVIRKYGYPIISKDISGAIYEVRVAKRKGVDYSALSRYKKLSGTLMFEGEKSPYCCEKYFPLLDAEFNTSDRCCAVMKKAPVKQYEKKTDKKPIIATMAEESRMRESSWMKTGCNAFNAKRQHSKPMSFWTEQDVLQYIKQNDLPIASVYGEIVETDSDGCEYTANLLGEKVGSYKTTGCARTGCVFCGFGCHLEKEPSRFQRLKQTHPRQYEYCIGGGEYDADGIWKPNDKGLGMGHVFDELNKIYGDGFIKY